MAWVYSFFSVVLFSFLFLLILNEHKNTYSNERTQFIHSTHSYADTMMYCIVCGVYMLAGYLCWLSVRAPSTPYMRICAVVSMAVPVASRQVAFITLIPSSYICGCNVYLCHATAKHQLNSRSAVIVWVHLQHTL